MQQSICPNCKSAVSPDDAVCGYCGYNLSGETTLTMIARLVPAAFLILVFVGILLMLAYSQVTYYLGTQGIITTPLFWRATSTTTNTVTLTITRTPRNTRTPTTTLTLVPSETLTPTATITLTPSLIPTSTLTPSFTPTITPVPTNTKKPSATTRPSATTKATNPAATTVVNPTTAPSLVPTSTLSGSPTPTIGALSDPVQFLRAYYNLINNRIYETAWSWLSANFIATKSQGLDHTFSYTIDYVPYWNNVLSVEILNITLESSTTDNAQVLLQVRYNMTNGTNSIYYQRLSLIKSIVGPPWMIDASVITNTPP